MEEGVRCEGACIHNPRHALVPRIEQLAADEIEARDRAHQALVDAGEPALLALRWYGPYTREAVTDPAGPSEEGPERCIRGGSRIIGESLCGSAGRSLYAPKNRNGYIGLRVALH